jgi:NDP-sugar pyrophosphorylase family protein
MILAAGLGTRFKPWTDRHPKALAPVNGKSLLQRNIEYLRQYGIGEVVVNVHHFAEQIEEALAVNQGWGSHYIISDETTAVLETGGGLKKARPFLQDAPFVLMNVDILTDMDLGAMINDHLAHLPLATLAITDRITSRYFLFDTKDELCGWRNVKTGQERIARSAVSVQKAFSGIHVIDPSIFPLMGREGKFSVVDVYLDLAAGHSIRGHDHSHSKLIDVGKPESAEQAALLFA